MDKREENEAIGTKKLSFFYTKKREWFWILYLYPFLRIRIVVL